MSPTTAPAPPPAAGDSPNWRVEQDYVDYTTVLLAAVMCIAGLLLCVCASQLAFLLTYRCCCPSEARAQLGSNLFGRSLTDRWRRRRRSVGRHLQSSKLEEDAEAAATAAVELKRHVSV